MALDHAPRPDDCRLAPETTFRLSEDTYLEPDIVIYPRATGLAGITGPNVLLVVEIADSSLRYDMGRKAELYAAFGVRELWVIDAVKMTTRVFRGRHRTAMAKPRLRRGRHAHSRFRAGGLRAAARRTRTRSDHAQAGFFSFTTLCSVSSAVSKNRFTPRAAWRMRCSFSTSARRT